MMAENTRPGLPEYLLLYDGVCGLCHGFVRFVLRWDARGEIYFAPLQGALAGAALRRIGVDAGSLESIVLLIDAGTEQERMLQQSDAVIEVMQHLAQPLPMLARVMRWFPSGLRNAVYGMVARYRYHFFGKVATVGDVCELPSPANSARFL